MFENQLLIEQLNKRMELMKTFFLMASLILSEQPDNKQANEMRDQISLSYSTLIDLNEIAALSALNENEETETIFLNLNEGVKFFIAACQNVKSLVAVS